MKDRSLVKLLDIFNSLKTEEIYSEILMKNLCSKILMLWSTNWLFN